MKTSILGKTGIRVTEMGHGTLILGKLQAQLSPEEGAEALKRSYELGVRFIDTAQLYEVYPHIRKFLDEIKPNDVVIASKSHAKTFEEMNNAVEECLKALNLKHIDIFHLHALFDDEDLKNRNGALDALIKCKEKGTIRAIGISSHSVKGMKAVKNIGEIEIVHPILNKNCLGLVEGTKEELINELSSLRKRGVGAYAMKIFAGGHYINDMENCLQYVRQTGLVDAMAVGMKTPQEVEMDVKLFERGYLDENDRKILSSFKKKLIIYDRCKRCGKCVKACQQGAMVLGPKKAENITSKCILCGYCAKSCPEFVIRVI